MSRADSPKTGDPVIITGAAGGIGRACVERLLAEGYSVTSVDRDFSRNDIVECDGLQLISGDLGELEFLSQIPELAAERWGRAATGLVNNAALSIPETALDITAASWDATIAVNLTAPMFLSQAFARILVAEGLRGRIVNVSSVNATAAERDSAAYVSSKSGLEGLTRALALDLAAQGIAVNSLAPGVIWTDSARERNGGEEFATAIARRVPMRRAGTADDVAGLVDFLLRVSPDYVTGTTMTVDGGLTAALLWDES